MRKNWPVMLIVGWMIAGTALATCGSFPDPDIDDRGGCPPCPCESETPDE